MTAVMATEESSLMTTDQAAAWLKVHPETIRRAVARGELNSYRAGRNLRFRREDLEKYLTRHQA